MKKTNREKWLAGVTDKELADFLMEGMECDECPLGEKCDPEGDCRENFKKWLSEREAEK